MFSKVPRSSEVLDAEVEGEHLQVCLTSNVARGYKVPSFAEHPARAFYESGIPFSLRCDNLLLSGDSPEAPDPTGEILHLVCVADGHRILFWTIFGRFCVFCLFGTFAETRPFPYKEFGSKFRSTTKRTYFGQNNSLFRLKKDFFRIKFFKWNF